MRIRCSYVGNTDWAILNFRKGLIKSLQKKGVDVSVICSDSGFFDDLRSLGIDGQIGVKNYVKNISPLRDIALFLEYGRVYGILSPHIVHHFTIKPIIYGSLAARIAKVPVIVNTITGLGYIFSEGQGRLAWLRFLACGLYKVAGLFSDHFSFQNRDDMEYFIRRKIVPRKKCSFVFGSGVDLGWFSPENVDKEKVIMIREELELENYDNIVLMVGRMLHEKGVREFVEAGSNIVLKNNRVKFILAGPLAPGNPSMIPIEQIREWVDGVNVQYLGRRADIRELMLVADMVVLASYYREGIPKSLLEAAAMGKPIITTNTVGCREVVNDGENGLLVPVRNSRALQEAIEKLLLNPELRTVMGKRSRERAIKEFDETKVIAQTLVMYRKLLARRGIKVAFGDLDASAGRG
jgi:N,N'-diacetylbacillosaminyl-diphospho-undecaprenol alpha-1,3-N-acetylgalactosaminyltransferase